MSPTDFSLSVHALRRMFERGITDDDIEIVLESGQVIGEYPDDEPYPSRLLLGWAGTRPIHVVAAMDPVSEETVIVTVYEPEAECWQPGFERRRPE